MYRVTVHLKSGTPVVVYCVNKNDIVYETECICVYNVASKWMFRKSEIEYITIEKGVKPCQ